MSNLLYICFEGLFIQTLKFGTMPKMRENHQIY